MSRPLWMAIAVGYPFLVALIVIWLRGATRASSPPPPLTLAPQQATPWSTMKDEALGRQVARFDVLEHIAADEELLEFHIPPPETPADWTVDQVAELLAGIDALSQPSERETL